MRIVYVIARLNNAGPVNQLLYLVNSMCKKDCEISILTLFEEGNESRWNDFERCGVKDITCLKLKKKVDVFTSQKKVRVYMEKKRPDIVHSATLPADILICCCRSIMYKWCSTLHCNIYNDYYERFSNGLAKLNIFMHEACIKKMDVVVCCAKSIVEQYNKCVKSDITAIQNGINYHNFNWTIEKCRERYELLGLDRTKKILLVVGSIDERKNTLEIIEELKNWTGLKKIQVVFLGEGKILDKCKEKTNDENFLFKGKVNNVKDYLQCADVYISLSKSEGLPLSVLEAGGYGLKMILSDIPAHREIADYDEVKSGILFYPLGSGNLGKVVQQCIETNEINRDEIAKYYVQYFGADAMAEKYFDIYKKMLV